NGMFSHRSVLMDNSMNEPSAPRQRRLMLRILAAVVGVVAVYLVFAYLLMPALWVRYATRHPALDNLPDITYTHDDHPSDPINVALIGSEDDLKSVFQAAGWFAADALG